MENLPYEPVIKEVKRRLSIINLIEAYLSLKRSGKSYVGLCPFHDDKNPSFHVDGEKGLFHCFACGAGGDMFGFMMRYNNLTFPEAVKELARRADVSLEERHQPPKRKSQRDILFKVNSLVSRFYKALLEGRGGKGALDYLLGRGISFETVKEFGLGYAPGGWDALAKFLAAKNIPLSVAEKIGLVIRRKDKDGYYDRFRNRVIFPIRDVDGKVVGFGGRALNGEEPKYMNSPESEIYHKKGILYGLDKSRDYIRRKGQALVVEGYMDFLSLYSAGINNVVATLGTSLTRDHATLLKRYTDKTVVIFDRDEAGTKASRKAFKIFLDASAGELAPVISISLRVFKDFLEQKLSLCMVELPEGDDPASFISKGRQDEFQRRVENAKPLLDFFIEGPVRDFQEGKITRSRAIQEIVDVVASITDPIERSYCVKRVAESFGVREIEILSLIKYGEKIGKEKAKIRGTPNTEEKLILKTLIKFPVYSDYLKKENLLDFIPEGETRAIIEEVVLNGFEDVSSLLVRFNNSSIQEVISEFIFSSDDIPDEPTAGKVLKDCIRKLKLKKVEDSLRVLRLKIDQAIGERDGTLEKRLMKEYRDLVEQEKNIKGRNS